MDRTPRKYGGRAGELSRKLLEMARRRTSGSGLGVGAPRAFFFADLPQDTLGLYDPEQEIVLISNDLVTAPWEILMQVALHECAHHLTWKRYYDLSHGMLFKDSCAKIGAESDYSRAKVDMRRRSSALEKVRKLKALSASPYEAESQSAMRKLREIMASYGIEDENGGNPEDGIWGIDLAGGTSSRIQAPDRCVASIAGMNTGAFVVQERALDGNSVIRCYGSLTEVEVAAYVADTIRVAIEKEYRKLKREGGYEYQGVAARNTFYIGVLSAMSERFNQEKKSGDPSTTALVLRSGDNRQKTIDEVFGDGSTLTKRGMSSSGSRKVYEEGKSFGSSLQVNKGVGGNSGQKLRLTD